jgi:hypothetical protein
MSFIWPNRGCQFSHRSRNVWAFEGMLKKLIVVKQINVRQLMVRLQ